MHSVYAKYEFHFIHPVMVRAQIVPNEAKDMLTYKEKRQFMNSLSFGFTIKDNFPYQIRIVIVLRIKEGKQFKWPDK